MGIRLGRASQTAEVTVCPITPCPAYVTIFQKSISKRLPGTTSTVERRETKQKKSFSTRQGSSRRQEDPALNAVFLLKTLDLFLPYTSFRFSQRISDCKRLLNFLSQ